MNTEYIINETEEIRQVVIGLMDLHARYNIEREYPNCSVDMAEMAEMRTKRQLLDSVEGLIKTTTYEDRGYVESVIYMPFVRDKQIKYFESHLKHVRREVVTLKDRNVKLAGHIKYLEKPWHMKLYLAVKRYFK